MEQLSSRLRCRRVYRLPEAEDHLRVLVDRLWPRGLSKESARLDLWCRELAPGDELRHWFGHRSDRWEGFRKRYLDELRARPQAVQELLERIREAGGATLLHAAKDPDHNNAVVLLEYLRHRLGEGRS